MRCAPPCRLGTALVDFIRANQRLTGTRVGCREGDCGACTVLLGALASRRRRALPRRGLLPVAPGRRRRAPRGHHRGAERRVDLTPVQQAMVGEGASQCGFCTPGLVVSLSGFLLNDAELLERRRRHRHRGQRLPLHRLRVDPQGGGAPAARAAAAAAGRSRPPAGAGRARRLARAISPPSPARLQALATGPQRRRKKAPPWSWPAAPTFLCSAVPSWRSRSCGSFRAAPVFAAIWPDADRVFIGAAATVADMMESPLLAAALPWLAGPLRRVSSAQVRNRATVGGNIVNASPIGDLSVILLALRCRHRPAPGARATRQLPLRDFFLGYKQLDAAAGRGQWPG
ncbi:MAG: FAD binding domain-containing protein [Rhodopseudomonas palustris]|nr:FAD binding domain-containing protein [Rhodopseudomonas palustris]